MKVGIVGQGQHVPWRARAAHALGAATLRHGQEAENESLAHVLEDLDVVMIAGPTADHFRIAEGAAKRGVHIFLEWPPATSIRECKRIADLAEEAGIEVGVSRPLRFHSLFDAMPERWRAELIVLRQDVVSDERAAWPQWLADAVDLCCAFAQGSSVQRIDAEAVRGQAAWPDAVAFALRFHSGTYAQVSLRRGAATAESALYVAGPGFQFETDLVGSNIRQHPVEQHEGPTGAEGESTEERSGLPSLLVAETQAFLQAVAEHRPAPVSVLDGVHTMRLVERLMERLR